MGSDLLKTSANERIDLTDFDFLSDGGFQANLRQLNTDFLTRPTGQQSWILEGFAMSNPSGKQLQVTKGRALLGQREGAQTFPGALTIEGDATKTIDMSLISTAVYNVYIRFEYVDGDTGSRIFWNPAGTGSELAQTVATRRLANWSLRVETSNPGAEWTKIGTADNTGVSLVLVDERSLYFEGDVQSSYASGWSSDGGGIANDRNADRQQYGTMDLQKFVASMRQCLEDVKGRGLRRWWDRGIGGMNVGFDDDPVEDRLAVGDQYFAMGWDSGNPFLRFDNGDFIQFDRGGTYVNNFRMFVDNIEEARLGASGLAVSNGIYAGNPNVVPTNGEVRAVGAVHAGTYLYADTGRLYLGADDYMNWDGVGWKLILNAVEEVKFSAAGLNIADGIYVGSLVTAPTSGEIAASGAIHAGGYLYGATRLYLDSNDYLDCDGTKWLVVIDNIEEMRVSATGVNVSNGLRVGDATAPVNGEISATSHIRSGGYVHAVNRVYVGTDDYVVWDGTNWQWMLNNVERMRLTAVGLTVANGLYVGVTGAVPSDNTIQSEGFMYAGTSMSAGTYVSAGTFVQAASYLRGQQLYLVPQAAVTATAGYLHSNSIKGNRLGLYNGTKEVGIPVGFFTNVSDDPQEITSNSSYANFLDQVVIPGGTLQIGSVVKISASFRVKTYVGGGAPTGNMRFYINAKGPGWASQLFSTKTRARWWSVNGTIEAEFVTYRVSSSLIATTNMKAVGRSDPGGYAGSYDCDLVHSAGWDAGFQRNDTDITLYAAIYDDGSNDIVQLITYTVEIFDHA